MHAHVDARVLCACSRGYVRTRACRRTRIMRTLARLCAYVRCCGIAGQEKMLDRGPGLNRATGLITHPIDASCAVLWSRIGITVFTGTPPLSLSRCVWRVGCVPWQRDGTTHKGGYHGAVREGSKIIRPEICNGWGHPTPSAEGGDFAPQAKKMWI